MGSISSSELALEVERVKLKTDHPHLIVDDGNSLVTAAKNIRIELKRAFHGVKFGVTSSRFSGGDSISVRWIDGPTTKDVDAIVNKYKAGSFDGTDDSYTYDFTGWTRVFGDAKYVSTSREYSDDTVSGAITIVSEQFGADPISVDDYRHGRAWGWHSKGGADLGRELSIILSGMTCVVVGGAQ